MILFYESRHEQVTGAQQSMLTLASAYAQRGEPVVVASLTSGPLLAAASQRGLDTVSLGAPAAVAGFGRRGRIRALLDLVMLLPAVNWVFLRALAVLRSVRPDVICINSPAGGLFFGPWARLLDIPLIWYVRIETRQRFTFWLSGLLADRILLISEGVKTAFTPRELRRWGDKMEVLHTGFPDLAGTPGSPEELERQIAEEQGQSLPAERPRFLLLGSYGPRKGQPDAVLAYARYRASGGTGVLVFCGYAARQEIVDELVRLADSLGVSDGVVFLRETRLPRALLRVCDVAILPSRAEGLPRVIVEALAEGRRVIAYPVSGARELIRNAHCGVVLDEPVPEQLGDAMLAAEQDAEADRFEAERQQAVAHLTLERYVTGFMKVCDALRTSAA